VTELIKQRLVGMLIVVIAGVVFLPDLLDGKKQLTKEEFKKVPAKPEVDEQPILTEFPRQEVVEAMLTAPQPSEREADDSELEGSDEVASAVQSVPEIENADLVKSLREDEGRSEVNIQANQRLQVAKQSEFKKQAWILQLGSFKHKENVDALRQKLKEAGFDTFTKPVKTKAGLLSKVYIGPEFSKATLEVAQTKLKEIAGIEGKITRFDPIK